MKFLDAKTEVCSEKVLIEGFKCEINKMKLKLENLRNLKVKHSEVVVIKEQKMDLEKWERKITKLKEELESSQKEHFETFN